MVDRSSGSSCEPSGQNAILLMPPPLPEPALAPPGTQPVQHQPIPAERTRPNFAKITKADIGMPQDLKHIAHVGWDTNKGFVVDNAPEDDKLRSFFKKAGVSETQLQDPETREFIYDFIDKHGGVPPVKQNLDKAGGQRNSKINQALIYMICKDNMPLSCVEKRGLQKFTHIVCPRYKLPLRSTITCLMEQKYATTKAILKKKICETANVALTSDIITLNNSSRSFIVVTAHFLNTDNAIPELEAVTLTAQRMSQAYTADYIKECFENITQEFSIQRNTILSMTTDDGADIVAAVGQFLGDEKRIPCMVHLLNLIVDGALAKVNLPVSELANRVKAIVTYFKQSVNAMNELKAEQVGFGKKEGQVLTLIQSVSTRWNLCLDMLERFNILSPIVAKILARRQNAPDMISSSQLNVIRDLVALFTPFKQAIEDVSGDQYISASLVIPIADLLQKELEQAKPSTDIGVSVQQMLLDGVVGRLGQLKQNLILAKATILDPRFKRIYFNSPLAVSELSTEIRLEHRRRGQVSPEVISTTQSTIPKSEDSIPSLWSRHEFFFKNLATTNSSSSISSGDGIPKELDEYLFQPVIPRKDNPLKFWTDSSQFTPVLSEIALKYLIPTASSVSPELVASAVNLSVPNIRSRHSAEHIKLRVFLSSLSDKYWFA